MSAQGTSGSGSVPGAEGSTAGPTGAEAPASPAFSLTRRRARQFTTTVVIAVAVGLLAVGVGGGFALGAYVTKSTSSTIDITETGSTLLEPLMDIWGPNYTSHVDSHVIVSPSGGGSGQGQSEAEAGVIDIGASDAYTLHTLGVADVPLAISSQLVVYNLGPSFHGRHLNLNGTILAMIYMDDITNWNNSLIQDANPGVVLPHQTITPIIRADSSGDTYIFSVYCDMSYAAWPYLNSTGAFSSNPPADSKSGTGNIGVVDELNNITGGVGYVGISYKSDVDGSANLGYAALGDNLANSAAGGNVLAHPSSAKNYINWSVANVSEDVGLGLEELNYSAWGLAVSLILGGSPLGATVWNVGGGGTDPTTANPSPYPIVNLEYAIVKTNPPSLSHQAYVVQFLEWAISYGNNVTLYLGQVNFIPLTVQLLGLDQETLATVHISS